MRTCLTYENTLLCALKIIKLIPFDFSNLNDKLRIYHASHNYRRCVVASPCMHHGVLGHFFRPGGGRFTTVLKTDTIPSKIECTLTKCRIDGIIIHVVFVFVVENIYRNASRLVYRCVNTEKQIYIYIYFFTRCCRLKNRNSYCLLQ